MHLSNASRDAHPQRDKTESEQCCLSLKQGRVPGGREIVMRRLHLRRLGRGGWGSLLSEAITARVSLSVHKISNEHVYTDLDWIEHRQTGVLAIGGRALRWDGVL